MSAESVAPATVPPWARAMTNAVDFNAEQEKFGQIWTFLGFDFDIANRDDWFRTTLGGKSIFVQRFETGIRAFENRCAHRFYPLRTEDKGNGPVVCGFHHWRYNADGLALGIPKCPEMFGKTPREMDARLPAVEIAQCGPMIFGRFPGGPDTPLKEWLGDGWDILTHLTAGTRPLTRIDTLVKAHWKLLIEISLDDYHLVAVHPTTFGKSGYLPTEILRYVHFGAHSAYIPDGDAAALGTLASQCRDGSYRARRYRIFQFFPNLIVAVARAIDYLGDSYWYLVVQHLVPEAHDRTRSTFRIFPLPFARPAPPLRRLIRAWTQPFMVRSFTYFARRVQKEDSEACEKLQTVVGQAGGEQTLALQEARIGWFEQDYARVIAGTLGDVSARTVETLPVDSPAS